MRPRPRLSCEGQMLGLSIPSNPGLARHEMRSGLSCPWLTCRPLVVTVPGYFESSSMLLRQEKASVRGGSSTRDHNRSGKGMELSAATRQTAIWTCGSEGKVHVEGARGSCRKMSFRLLEPRTPQSWLSSQLRVRSSACIVPNRVRKRLGFRFELLDKFPDGSRSLTRLDTGRCNGIWPIY